MTSPPRINRYIIPDSLSDLPDRSRRLPNAITHAATQSPITSTNDQTNDISKDTTESNNKTNSKSTSQNNYDCTNDPNDQAHQCIARSDGVVRALRARTGDQHWTVFKIVSAVYYEIVSEDS